MQGGRLLALLTRASGPLEKADTLERMRYDRWSANAAVGDPTEIGLQCVAQQS